MRIGMMLDVYKPHVSGVTHYVELNKRYLERAGHDVFVFTFGDQDYDDGERRVIRSPALPLVHTGYYLSFTYSRAAKRLLQTMDVVHVQHPFVSGNLALRYCQPLRIPTMFTNHTRYDLYAQAYLPIVPSEVSGLLLQAYMPSFCQAIDAVVSPSAGMADVLRSMGVTGPIEIIPNGVDVQKFYNAKPLRRSDFGYTEKDIILVYSGRVASEKNMGFLMEAFAGVARAVDHVQLLIVGGGPKPIEDELRTLAAELHLADRIRFTGMVPYDAIAPHLLMCDAFVTASVTEVHPLSVIEGMACGLPVVGIQSPGVSDTVEDGKTGFLSTEDLPSFTAKLTRLCLDTKLRKKMREAAREASGRYDIERTGRTLLSAYERLVREAQPRRENWSVRLRAVLENYLR